MTDNFKCFLIVLFTVFSIFYIGKSRAETTLYLGQLSTHHGEEGVKREDHGLIGIERNNWLAGWWRNSLNKDAFAVGYRASAKSGHFGSSMARLFAHKDIDAGIKFGFASGYPSPVFATLNLQYKNIDINHIPDIVTSVGLKFDF